MSVLSDVSGSFALTLGTHIKARVAPINSIGQGSWSTANTIGILAQTVPLQPGSAPTRDSSSS